MCSVTSDIFSEKTLHYKLFSPQKFFSPCNVCFNLPRMGSQGEEKVDLTVPRRHTVKVFSCSRRDLSSVNVLGNNYYHQVKSSV